MPTSSSILEQNNAVSSHLLIHRDRADVSTGWSVEAVFNRLRARVGHVRQAQDLQLTVEIHDLQGHRWTVVQQLPELLDLTLPAGVYHISTERCGLRRRYTVALGQGESLDLYLRAGDAARR